MPIGHRTSVGKDPHCLLFQLLMPASSAVIGNNIRNIVVLKSWKKGGTIRESESQFVAQFHDDSKIKTDRYCE